MLYYLVAAAMIVHTIYWGVGLAWLTLPRVWRPAWWVLAPAYGLALQSAVVWTGAHAGLAGASSYAVGSEVLPAILLGLALIRRRPVRGGSFAGGRRPGLPGVLLLATGLMAGWLLLSPLAHRGGWTLTSSSLGSCDQADYAAGARVLQDFSRHDRTGFLGQSEVTRVRSTEFFFDYFIRQNHFTPSAIIAHTGAVFGLRPHQLVSLTGAVFTLLTIPLVAWLARVLLGVRGIWATGVAALYAFSPLNAYGMHHGALGQMLAAHGIAVLTAATVGAALARRRGRPVWAFASPALVALWLLAGSYNFILTVALAPAGAWLLVDGVRRRDAGTPVRTVLMVGAMLALCGVAFWGRFVGLADRFALFEQYSFGWPVPRLLPEAWLGLVRNPGLEPWPGAGGIALGAAVAAIWLAGMAVLWRRRGAAALTGPVLAAPVVAGWMILTQEAATRTNASYDAYKLLAVFLPGLLASYFAWLAAMPQSRRGWRCVVGLGLVLLIAANIVTSDRFRTAMQRPPLRVDRNLTDLAQWEGDANITSVNLRIGSFWHRLWANYFLLLKPQYFPTHTYEARLNTPLRGEWDLSDSLLRVTPLQPEAYRRLNQGFHAIRAGAAGPVSLDFAGGWHGEEGDTTRRWRWAGPGARLRVFNPSDRTAGLHLTVRGRALGSRQIGWRRADQIGAEYQRAQDGRLQSFNFGPWWLPPGDSELVLETDQPARLPPDDGRELVFALEELEATATGPETFPPAARPRH